MRCWFWMVMVMCVATTGRSAMGQQVGACCLPDGTCVEVTSAECMDLTGASGSPGTPCQSVLCAITVGACCLPDGTCVEVTSAECMAFWAYTDPDQPHDEEQDFLTIISGEESPKFVSIDRQKTIDGINEVLRGWDRMSETIWEYQIRDRAVVRVYPQGWTLAGEGGLAYDALLSFAERSGLEWHPPPSWHG